MKTQCVVQSTAPIEVVEKETINAVYLLMKDDPNFVSCMILNIVGVYPEPNEMQNHTLVKRNAFAAISYLITYTITLKEKLEIEIDELREVSIAIRLTFKTLEQGSKNFRKPNKATVLCSSQPTVIWGQLVNFELIRIFSGHSH